MFAASLVAPASAGAQDGRPDLFVLRVLAPFDRTSPTLALRGGQLFRLPNVFVRNIGDGPSRPATVNLNLRGNYTLDFPIGNAAPLEPAFNTQVVGRSIRLPLVAGRYRASVCVNRFPRRFAERSLSNNCSSLGRPVEISVPRRSYGPFVAGPTPLNLGDVRVGSRRNATLSLRTTSDNPTGPLTYVLTTNRPDAFEYAGCSQVSGACAMRVTFEPPDPDTYSATLRIYGYNVVQTVTLRGSAFR